MDSQPKFELKLLFSKLLKKSVKFYYILLCKIGANGNFIFHFFLLNISNSAKLEMIQLIEMIHNENKQTNNTEALLIC